MAYNMDEGCLIHKYTYLLDDGRDVAVVLLHGLGVLVVLEGRHGGAARSPAPRSHANLAARRFVF